MKKRVLSIILTLCMVFMLMPTVVMASDVTVTTEEELREAVQSGGTINLGAHIALTEPLLVNDPAQFGFSLTLNMNGYTLTGTIKLTACEFILNGRLDANVEAKAYVDPSNSWPSNLYGGTYAGEVYFDTTSIHSGTFKNKVSGPGYIEGGTFYGDVNCWGVTGGSFLGSCTVTDRIWNGIFYGAYDQDKVGADYTLIYNSDDEVHAIEFCSNRRPFRGAEAPGKKGYSFLGWYEKDINGEFWETPMEFPFRADNLRLGTVINVYALWQEDSKTPVISGVEDGKTYCSEQTVTVSDNDAILSVTVNGEPITLENNQFTLLPAEGTQTILATDKALNTTEVTVTINDGHTYDWQTENGQYWKQCRYCDDHFAKKEIPTITITGADQVCATQDYRFSFTLPEGTTDAVYGYDFTVKGEYGIPAIAENNELYGFVSTQWYALNQTSFQVFAGATTADGFEFFVSKTVTLLSEHTGGTATCTEKAICEVCGQAYGELDSTNHNLVHVPAKDATITETGNMEYWHCLDCGKYFADEKGENEIELNDIIIQKLPPEMIEGFGQSVIAGEKKELSFTSNAPLSAFIRVEFDGEPLDEEYYTVTEGSIQITLKADFVAALSAGEHTIGIVSESGTASAAFTVIPLSPPTGDNSHIVLWTALLLISGSLLTIMGVYSKKKRFEK